MVLELIAINMFLDAWHNKNWFIAVASVILFVVDIVSDIVGIPT